MPSYSFNVPNHRTQAKHFVIWKTLDGCSKIVSQCLNLWCRSYWILNNFVKENPIKSRLFFLRKIGPSSSMLLESFWWMGFLGNDIVVFRPKVRIFLNFEWILSLQTNLNSFYTIEIYSHDLVHTWTLT